MRHKDDKRIKKHTLGEAMRIVISSENGNVAQHFGRCPEFTLVDIENGIVIKKEILKLTSGTYDTYLIEPEMTHVSGVFEKSKNAKIQVWVTADRRRMPVKIKSKVVVGSFVGELISSTGLGEK